jgi:splicing factor 1
VVCARAFSRDSATSSDRQEGHFQNPKTSIMSWRGQGTTGSNNIPLGNRRRFGGEDGSPLPEESYSSGPVEGESLKRGRSPVRGIRVASPFAAICSSSSAELNPDGTKKRKKRNRWGDATDNKAAGLMNLPTAVLGNMTSEQLDAYTLHLRIEEISQKLRINDVVPADGDR